MGDMGTSRGESDAPKKFEKGGKSNGTAQHPFGSGKDGAGRSFARKQLAPDDRGSGRGDPADRQHLSDESDRDERAGPPDRQLSVPGANRIWQDTNRRGHRGGFAQEPARGNQNRLRGVPAQP